MVGMFGEKVPLSQANGPDVELVVKGTQFYATYETPDGFPVVYDDALGLYCYAVLIDGEFKTTGIPVTSPPPPNVERHAQESADVKLRKANDRQREQERRAHGASKEE